MSIRTDGSLEQALVDVIGEWRRSRSPRLGDLADVLSTQALAAAPRAPLAASKKRADLAAWVERERDHHVLDFPSLVATARGGSQEDVVAHVEALAAWDDPRLGRGLIALLENPPYAGVKSRGMLQAILTALENTRDPRLPSLLRELAGRYLQIVHSGTGGWMINQMNALATRLEALPPPPALAPAIETAVAALEDRVGRDAFEPLRAAERKARAKASLAELYAAVYAAPDDDGPRLVLADALLELGDPRGELIVLQVQRARGEPQTDEQRLRENELLGDPKRLASWAQPLSNVGDCRFERGFPDRVTFFAKPSRPALEDPSWATVRTVQIRLPRGLTVDFLSSARLAGVRDPGSLDAELLAALAERQAPRPYTQLDIRDAPALAATAFEPYPFVDDLTLELKEGSIVEGLLRPLTRLRKLALHDVRTLPDGLFDGLTSLDELAIDVARTPSNEEPPPLALPSLPPTLSSLRLHAEGSLPAGALANGARLRRLALRVGNMVGLDEAFSRLAMLEHLELQAAGEAPPRLFESLGHLRSLNLWMRLSSRGMTMLPRAMFAPLSSLTVLKVSYAEVEPQALAHLERLESFEGACVPLAALPRAPLRVVDASAGGAAAPAALEALLAQTPTLERLILHLDLESQNLLSALVAALAASTTLVSCTLAQHGQVSIERGSDGKLSRLVLNGYGSELPLAIARALPSVTAVRAAYPSYSSVQREVARALKLT